MATGSKRKRTDSEMTSSITDDVIATREVWSEHMAVIMPNAMGLASDVGKMLVDLGQSPLGQRARRNPEISFAIGALSIGVLSRLLRFR
jgi:hypothetical protein